jgi:hypothetical protein
VQPIGSDEQIAKYSYYRHLEAGNVGKTIALAFTGTFFS